MKDRMEIVIEPVTESEIAVLASISKKTFYDTFHRQNTKEDMDLFLQNTFSDAALAEEVADKSNSFFFA